MSWKGEVKQRRCVGKKEQVVSTPLPPTCVIPTISAFVQRGMIIQHTLYYSGKVGGLDSTSQQPLCTTGLQKCSRETGMLKQFPRLLKTCWALQGPGASPEGLRGAAQDLVPGLAAAQTTGVPGGLHPLRQRCLAADPLELALIETAAVLVQDIISLHKACCSAYVDDTKCWDKAVLIRDIQRANTSLLARAVMLDVLPSEVHRIAAVATCCSCFAERLWI